jgi:CubicO group peptidase (beta-lactamase class C family)
MRRRALLTATLAAPWVARAQPAPPASWSRTFADWAEANAVRQGSIVAMRQGRIVHASGIGGQAPSSRLPIWSLSKFITGVATAQLIGEGKVRLETPIGAAMPRTFAAAGVAADGPLGRLPLALLLTHRSGLPTQLDGQSIPGLRAQLDRLSPARIAFADLQAGVLAMRPVNPPGAQYVYSNANFLLLGLMLAEQRGRPYEREVAARLLAPLGIRGAGLDPEWRVLEATGGWRLAPAEYLVFVHRALGGGGPIPAPVAAWMRDPADKAIGVGSPVHYALGALVRPVAGGANFFHSGRWSWRQQTPRGLLTGAGGSRFTYAVDGTAWCAVFPSSVDDGAAALDRLMWGPMRNPTDETSTDQLPALLRAAA